MKLHKITEGCVELFVPAVSKITAKNPAFFNPVQVTNRDISVLLAACLLKKDAAVLDLLSATGVRAIRFAKEVGLRNVFANDANPTAAKLIRKNAAHNKVKLKVFNLRAHELLARKYQLNKKIYFDYIDIDPFGTPVPFLDAAVKALVPNGGILAVTATDTANLCGVNVNACRRIYQSTPMHNELMHEIGIRILLKKVIEAGAQVNAHVVQR
jgi:tRNA (guanine26-N2/guanine27-N2)-dimethyltransferase